MKRLLCLILLAVCALGQTAKFPSSVAADSDLAVALDNSFSTLSAPVDNITTTLTVANGAKFTAGEIVSVNNEQMLITGISGNNLTVVRGFGGTTASAQNAGTLVSGYYTAWHHNALKNEIKAIESKLLDPSGLWLGSSGKVGVGTSGPSTPFQVHALPAEGSPYLGQVLITSPSTGSSGREAGVSINTTFGTGRSWSVMAGSGCGDSTCQMNFRIFDGTAAADRLNIDANGNVGISTIRPQANLDVVAISMPASWAQSGNGAFSIRTSAGATGEALMMGVHDGDFSWIQAAKAGTASRYLSLNPVGGNVGIGTTSPAQALDVNGSVLIEGSNTLLFGGSGNGALLSGGAGYMNIRTGSNAFNIDNNAGSANLITILNNGNVGLGAFNPTFRLQLGSDSAAKPTTSTWTISSDRRIKTNIRPFVDGLAVLRQLNPVTYELNGKAGLPAGVTGIGLIAQDAEPVIPYAIGTYKAKLNPDDAEETDIYNLNASSLTYVLINAVKDLIAQTVQPAYPSDIEPACDEEHRGQHRFVKDDLLGDQERVCGRAVDGSYAWKAVVQF